MSGDRRITNGIGPDPCSFANFHRIKVQHLSWNARVDFDSRRIHATALLKFKRSKDCPSDEPLVLDTDNLDIKHIYLVDRQGNLLPAKFTLGEQHPIYGSPLRIELESTTEKVQIEYSTTAQGQALHWADEALNRQIIRLYSIGQTRFNRQWIPLQDCSAVRMTWEAQVEVPSGMTALMSAQHVSCKADNTFGFKMERAVAPYLIAIVVGHVAFRELGPRTGVYAEPDLIDAAAWEFSEAEKILSAAENILGKYEWGRWDILVLPASSTFGGMENPCLTFVGPICVTGDRSMTDMLFHEGSHSWSGNQVTQYTWSDWFITEALTMYMERRLMEVFRGVDTADMSWQLGYDELMDALVTLPESDQILNIDLNRRDPEDGFNTVPFEKGSLFLLTLESKVGRKEMDRFIRRFVKKFGFKSLRNADWEAFLKTELLDKHPQAAAEMDLVEWIHKPGLPGDHVRTESWRFAKVDEVFDRFIEEDPSVAKDTCGWMKWEWQHFLHRLGAPSAATMARADATFRLTQATNPDVLPQWLAMSARARYTGADARIDAYVGEIGRARIVVPIYKGLIASGQKERARSLLEKNRGFYHPILIGVLEQLLGG